MRAPDCIKCVCQDYREQFASDEAMAESLRLTLDEARRLTNGASYPTLESMVEIQSVLRKAALAAERKREDLVF